MNEGHLTSETGNINQPLNDILTKIKNTGQEIMDNAQFKRGISVVIPTFKGEEVIEKCLDSLYHQTLERELFDILIIINGEKDGTEKIVSRYIKEKRMVNINLMYSPIANVASARNIGLDNAVREYTTFLDDDDYLSPNFLEELYKYADMDNVVLSQIVNVDEQGTLDAEHAINRQLLKAEQKSSLHLRDISMIATINACKLIPTKHLTGLRYNPDLKSGEDVVFFTELFAKSKWKYTIIPAEKNAIYYRVLRQNSVSRQRLTYDFNVTQRLDVIESLNNLLTEETDEVNFVKSKINAQSLFINRYLKAYPESREQVMLDIKKRNLKYISYPSINRDLADKLVISYCFPPFADTSANVMAKRIRKMNQVTDVIYNDMSVKRQKDKYVNRIIDDLIENRFMISSYSHFSKWEAIDEFIKLGMKKIKDKNKYKQIYSRAMFPASHFLAYQYKKENPHVEWIAEFSDPLIWNVNGSVRKAEISDEDYINTANKHIMESFKLPPIDHSNVFFWCEYLPYLFADKLVFTNVNQREYMINTFPVDEVKEMIRRKSEISEHPTLPEEYYQLYESKYHIDKNKTNIAYFGNFYQTRNLDDIFNGLEQLSDRTRGKLNIHIFTSQPDVLKAELINSKIAENVLVNPYVSYTEFLNLTTKFDCLIVNDAFTGELHHDNPYLPSKLSDYLGSKSKIWGIYEENSVLSKMPISYKSKIGDVSAVVRILEDLVNETHYGLKNRHYSDERVLVH